MEDLTDSGCDIDTSEAIGMPLPTDAGKLRLAILSESRRYHKLLRDVDMKTLRPADLEPTQEALISKVEALVEQVMRLERNMKNELSSTRLILPGL
ncbi:unnamed protein product [Clonostachys rosea]|uniref:Uncharacterized protein n=1 Tax=Bionectria ochroleuca TaxID=29856 RepID=A0ABY6TSD4_BIOOC|nr:unnamed protein product [Clonostachys rosea]